MNFLKKGPEIKLSEIKFPNFVLDVYYDLKERHLLPIALVLLVAIVAVPIVLSQSSGSEEAEAEAPVTSATASASGAGGSAQLVAKSMPGLRDYKRRLNGHETNPFKQHFTESKSESGEGGGSSSSSGSESSGSTESSGGGGTSTEVEYESEETRTHTKLTYYSYAIDVRVTTGGGQSEEEAEGQSMELGAGQSTIEGAQAATTTARASAKGSAHSQSSNTTVRHNLPELTMLPSRKAPALMYMGSTKDGKKALMVVSSDVDSLFGDAKCVLGSQTCQMIALETGLPETVIYGGSGRRFTIELLKIHLVESSKLNEAPLGESNKGKGKKNAG